MSFILGLLTSFYDLVATAYAYPWVSIAIFLVVGVCVFALVADGAISEACIALVRIAGLFISTPFLVLRRALRIFRSHAERESHYTSTLGLVSFRGTRLLYLGLFVSSMLILSVGIAVSVISLYPKVEMEKRDAIKADIKAEQLNQAQAAKTIADSQLPTFKASLKAAKDEAQKKYDAALADTNKLVRENGNGFTGPAITETLNASSLELLTSITENFEEGMKSCPGGGFTDFTIETCEKFSAYVRSIIKSRTEVVESWRDLQVKTNGEKNTVQLVEQAKLNLSASVKALTDMNAQLLSASKYVGEWVPHHLIAFGILLLQTFLYFFFFVWSGAISADVLSWVVMMMLSFEKKNTDQSQ